MSCQVVKARGIGIGVCLVLSSRVLLTSRLPLLWFNPPLGHRPQSFPLPVNVSVSQLDMQAQSSPTPSKNQTRQCKAASVDTSYINASLANIPPDFSVTMEDTKDSTPTPYEDGELGSVSFQWSPTATTKL